MTKTKYMKLAIFTILTVLAFPTFADDLGKSTYDHVCFMCHAQGVAGAPKIGDKAAWAPRIKQGKATLYEHALKGFTGDTGVMPMKGGRPDLSDAEVKAAVDYLISLSN